MEVLAARFGTLGEAEMAQSALEAAGIWSRVADENMIAIDWLYANAVGGVKVLVAESDLEGATEVLSNIAGETNVDVPPSEDPFEVDDVAGTACPSCGSEAVQRIPRLKLFGALSIVGFGLGVAVSQPLLGMTLIAAVGLIVAATPSHRCRECAERWSAEDAPAPYSEAPAPLPSDTVDVRCPNCGSIEFHRLMHRRLRASAMFATLAPSVIVPLWLLLPRWQCDSCGHRAWSR
jgi:Zn finger protein HypA/HybF involved in hydrogenase expression